MPKVCMVSLTMPTVCIVRTSTAQPHMVTVYTLKPYMGRLSLMRFYMVRLHQAVTLHVDALLLHEAACRMLLKSQAYNAE